MANTDFLRHGSMPQPRVLVVDDHREARVAMATYLSISGFSVTEAPTGQAAIAALRAGAAFRFLLTDLNLSDVDGFEVARAAREISPKIWIALVTGWSFDTDDAAEYGIDHVIFKPISLSELTATLRRQLEASSAD